MPWQSEGSFLIDMLHSPIPWNKISKTPCKGMRHMAQQALPVSIQTMVARQPPGTEIYYPQVADMSDARIQQAINQQIYQLAEYLFQQQFRQQGASSFDQMIGTFEIKTNERYVLSLTLSNYAIAAGFAHGLTLIKSLTFDIRTGKNYSLQDLFQSGAEYVKTLSDIVKKQISERDIQTLEPFDSISADQDYYIADKCLVLYFQLYEITPYYVGLPMFPISVFEIEELVTDDGPLGRMATAG